jgi:hypothetical protein
MHVGGILTDRGGSPVLRLRPAALAPEEEAATHEHNQQDDRTDTLHNEPPR